MRLLTRTLCVAALSLSAAARPAAAQIIVNGGAPNEGIGWNIFDDNRAATVFSVASPTTFDAIRFWGLLPLGALYNPNIYWQILHDVGGAPAATVAAEGNAVADATVRTELDAFPGFFSWQFDLAAGERTLAGGVYWLALHDGPLDPSGFNSSSLIWETTNTPSAYAIQTFSVDDNWDVNTQNGLAFELRGAPVVATPEPATLTLFATGLVAMGVTGRRIRGRKRDA